ncbi:MAG: MoaD/ThiS family protein [Chloroflexota bacterium]
MPEVVVTFYGHIRDVAPQGKMELGLPAGSTVADLLQRLVAELGEPFRERAFDEYGQLLPSLKVIVAGEVVEELEQVLGGEGAQVAVVVVPPVIGG